MTADSNGGVQEVLRPVRADHVGVSATRDQPRCLDKVQVRQEVLRSVGADHVGVSAAGDQPRCLDKVQV